MRGILADGATLPATLQPAREGSVVGAAEVICSFVPTRFALYSAFRYRASILINGSEESLTASGSRELMIPGDHNQELYSGLIRLHILHHACEEPIFGLGMIEELGRHGYRLSAGTIYPMLHRLETTGLLRSQEQRNGRRRRRTYRTTRAGEKALAAAKQKVWELFSELFEDQHSRKRNGTMRRRP